MRVRRFGKPIHTRAFGEHFVAEPVTALIQALPEWNRDTAVAVLDSALNRRRISHRDLGQIRRGVRGRRGAKKLWPWWDLVDGRADSPVETRARLECLDAGLPRPELQVRIADSQGVIVARGDMGWQRSDGSWLLVEIDGTSIHSQPSALYRDRRRHNAIALSGAHTQLRFTSADVAAGSMVGVIAAGLGRTAS